MEPILKTIKELSAIEPSEALRNRTRAMFTTTLSKRVFPYSIPSFLQTFHVAAALTATALLVITIFGGSHYLKQAFIPKALVGLDNEALLSEAALLRTDIDINLQEVDYYTRNSRRTVAAALQEASIAGPGHLNSQIIEREADAFTIDDPKNQDINKLLDQATL